ncbi:chromosome segregation protein SMC [Lactobacillus sp. CC-MHH1034]|uniref:chromosome segregation protein SMC n=1 Tax=Agrilactobacillus fermenti TaxID=2586909 RepID=UPI001E2F1D15|nr:chromosome segregation protein SMC [Agrilactobacillus fermenti]MCD2256234.1 chromosome segregation protein SMC [Agrilactobacillus fermenti]
MSLTSLIISGFKSFADKTELTFDKGVTGIVGPNGSGKSNITEAVRWAMGEQSAKGLRGEHMPDVIFAGTQLRPAMNLALVTLKFDNQDRALKKDADQIEITRKIFRDGTSEFYINQKSCRLKDIVSLFLDSGIGRSSFSIISQGQVEEIFNSRPEDRRTIIEETAGIHQYKIQKETTLKKLEQTTDNLNRVEDIIAELHDRVAPLHEQSSLAKEYLEQKKQYDHYMKSWLVISINQNSAEKTRLQQKINELNLTARQLAEAKATLAEDLTAAKKQQTKLERQLDNDQAQLVTATQKIEALKSQKALTKAHDQQQATQTKDLKKRIHDLTDQLTEQTQTCQQTTAQLALIEKKLTPVEAQIKQLTVTSGQSKADIQSKIDAENDQYLTYLQQQAEYRNHIQMSEKQKNILTHQVARIQAQQETLTAELTQLQKELGEKKAKIQSTENAQVSAQKELQTLEQTLTSEQQKYEQERQNLVNGLDVYQRAKAKLRSLEAFQREFSGYYQGPRYILQHRQELSGVLGSVSELMRVPEKFQEAIQAAIGSRLQDIVTDDELAAKKAIQHLRTNHQGRATFLPLTSIKTRTISSSDEAQLRQYNGFLGVGWQLVKTEVAYIRVCKHLLGTLVVVEALDQAIKIAQVTNRRFRIVTLAGDILNTNGAMSGGAQHKQTTNLLTQKNQIELGRTRVQNMDQTLQQKEHEVKSLQQHVALLKKQIAEFKNNHAADQTNFQQTQQQLTELTTALDYKKRECRAADYNLKSSTEQLNGLTREIEQTQQQQVQLEQNVTEARQTLNTLRQTLTDFDQTQQQLQNQINELKITKASLTADQRNFQQQLTQQQQRQRKTQRQLHDLEHALTDIQTAGHNKKLSLSEIETEIQVSKQQQLTLQTNIEHAQKMRINVKQQLDHLQGEVTRNIGLLENTRTEITTNQQQLDSVVEKIHNDLEQVETDYQTSFESLQSEVAQSKVVDLEVLQRKVKLLKRTLDEIGPVNLTAIEEYQKVKTRFDFLTQQQTDLLTAKNTLLETIGELDQEVRARFKATFRAVSEAFSEIFPKMFGGGQAALILTDPEDLLNTGVEIKASPPGKKLQKLSLLSGGERALTAITLLFAIIKVRPVPFCILDEVEASLDDANVARFADFLRAYDAKTQFIVITHRKGTMMRANRLYGVTMQESGVSKVVSVAISDQVSA